MIKFYINTEIQIPVNLMPLIDSSDLVTHVVDVAYDRADLVLVWNFVSVNGVQTQEVVTPTLSGDYEWRILGAGMYGIVIPASGGATVNNDKVGFGWFSGTASGVLAWRGPIISFQSTKTSFTVIYAGDEPPDSVVADVEAESLVGYDSTNALSLYRYARILGINPVHFSTAGDIKLADGQILFPLSDGRRFYQSESYHPSEGVSRDEINEAIADAESVVEDYLGSFVTPKWASRERIALKQHYDNNVGYVTKNLRGERIEYTTKWGNFIAGGKRGSYALSEDVPVIYSDPDGDGWNELATIEFELEHAGTSLYEIKCFFAGYGGSMQYEIRPPLSMNKTDSTVQITFETWKMINPILQEEFPTDDRNKIINLMDYGNVVTSVDIYRKYNSTTQDHAVFFYEECEEDFELAKQSGFIQLVNPEINSINIIPATYSDGAWTRSTIYGKLRYIEINYQSGFSYRPTYGSNFWDELHPELAKAIAYIATARLSRPLAGKPEVTALSQKLQADLSTTEQGGFRYTTNELIENPFGTHAGEIFAWRRLRNFQRKFRIHRN